jgi:hypothetical protein
MLQCRKRLFEMGLIERERKWQAKAIQKKAPKNYNY